jgi:hypothetical protein
MTRSHLSLTAALAQQIAAFIRAGGVPFVAAEAAGVPRGVFDRWLRRGSGPRASRRFRGLRQEVMQAHAQARLKAEVAILAERPLDWLRYGPGKDAPDAPGWSAAVRARPPVRDEDGAFADPEIAATMERLLDALTPYPEVRGKAARALVKEP